MTYQQIKVILKYVMIIIIIIVIILSLLKLYFISLLLSGLLVLIIIYYRKILKIVETTLCLIVKDNHVLMMLRNKKKNDVFINKYNGLGGKVEKGESKTACVLREVYEEAGIKLTKYNYVGKVVFKNFGYKVGKEVMYCFVGYEYENEIGYCNEGDLEWIPVENIMSLPLWEGDKYFLLNIVLNQPFTVHLHYENDKVINHMIKMKR